MGAVLVVVLDEVVEEPPELAQASIFDLIRAFQNVLKRFEEAHELADIVDDRFTVAEKIDHLLATGPPGASRRFDSLFAEASSSSEVIVTFLALLELMKMNEFGVNQDAILGNIEIFRKDHKPSASAV